MTTRVPLRQAGGDEATWLLESRLAPFASPQELVCEARAGALVRVDGIARGAFDREHDSVELGPSESERVLSLEVERTSLPTNGLPSGPGLKWNWLLRHASPAPPRSAELVEPPPVSPARAAAEPLRLWGHSHLDVAWLWSFGATRRKATRTFATAVALLERDPAFVFAQSQPQLYEYVRQADPELFARVRAL
ncbi:MAG TPA: hypothetical protein VGF18_09295, partial [Candidatus Tumulicola sp.]